MTDTAEPTTDERMPRGARDLLATSRRRVIAGSTAGALVLLLAGGAVYASAQNGDGTYRTALAEKADISETLALTGQVSAATSTDAAFQTDGTVAEVLVALGDEVSAGQALATLDPTELETAVTNAEDALAQAEQQLEEDLEAQSSGSSSSASSSGALQGSVPQGSSQNSAPQGSVPQGGTPQGSAPQGGQSTPAPDDPTTTPPDDDPTDPAVTEAVAAVTAAQQKLLAQYETTTAAQDASTQALGTAQTTCEPFMTATIEAGEVVPADPAEGEAAEGDAAEATTDAAGSNLDEVQALLAQCQQALADADGAQQQTSAAQSTLNDLAAELDAAVSALQQALSAEDPAAQGDDAPATPSDSDSGDDSDSDSDVSTAPSAYQGTSTLTVIAAVHTTSASASASAQLAAVTDPGQTGGGSGTVTAETILADRAAIDAAEAALAVAQRDRGFATLSSPIAGTVVSVGLAADDRVSAGSTDAVITVQADDGYLVETTVPLSRIAGVEVGQNADVTLPAFDTAYTATVSNIGILDVSETSTPSYTVTIALDPTEDDIRIGATAQAVVTLQTAEDVLTVPLSALSRSGQSQTVTVLQGGETQAVPVQIGAIGSERVEITDGLSAGDVVVLADLSQPIVSDSDSSSGSLQDLGGGSTTDRGVPGGFSPGDLPEGFQPPSG